MSRVYPDYVGVVSTYFFSHCGTPDGWKYDTVDSIQWLRIRVQAGVDHEFPIFRNYDTIRPLYGDGLIGQRPWPGFHRPDRGFYAWKVANPYARPIRTLEHAITIIQNQKDGAPRPRPVRKIFPKGHPDHKPFKREEECS